MIYLTMLNWLPIITFFMFTNFRSGDVSGFEGGIAGNLAEQLTVPGHFVVVESDAVDVVLAIHLTVL